MKAYRLQDTGLDTVEANEHLGFDADLRDYDICKTMLDKLNVQRVSLMTNNPRKEKALTELGIEIVERKPIDNGVTEDNKHYIATKRDKLGHKFKSNIFND